MKTFLYVLLLGLLASCSPQTFRQLAPADSVATSAPRRLLGLLPPKAPTAPALTVTPGQAAALPVMNFGKKSTIILQTGTGNSASTESGRRTTVKGGSQLATDSSTLNVATQGGNLAAVHGNDNELKQQARPPTSAGTNWKLLLGGVLLGAVGGALVVNRLVRGRWLL